MNPAFLRPGRLAVRNQATREKKYRAMFTRGGQTMFVSRRLVDRATEADALALKIWRRWKSLYEAAIVAAVQQRKSAAQVLAEADAVMQPLIQQHDAKVLADMVEETDRQMMQA